MAEIINNLPLLGKGGYHDASNGYVSHSRLHDFTERGPAFFHGRYITGEIEKKVTPALVGGQALEDLFLEGEDYFHQHYAVRPAHITNGTTSAAKQWKAAQRAGVHCISHEEYEELVAMCASLRTCDKGMALVNGCQKQVTFRAALHGLQMQARPDCVNLSDFGSYTVDIKTTRDLNEFLRREGPAVWKYGYHTQAALMRALLAANGYPAASAYLLVVESQEPYRRACIQISDDCLAWADRLIAQEAAKLKECFDTDTWPLGPDEIITLQKPRWVREPDPSDDGERGAA